ncbi:uncharacterized protein C20orf204 homolog [Tamandua tetradactyla]|uniref:uncharacterized protein C20orf204 homolog n=1 Tax=Tamandua tetradactyla TaxID=48850 RepID=UPI004053A7B0
MCLEEVFVLWQTISAEAGDLAGGHGVLSVLLSPSWSNGGNRLGVGQAAGLGLPEQGSPGANCLVQDPQEAPESPGTAREGPGQLQHPGAGANFKSPDRRLPRNPIGRPWGLPGGLLLPCHPHYRITQGQVPIVSAGTSLPPRPFSAPSPCSCLHGASEFLLIYGSHLHPLKQDRGFSCRTPLPRACWAVSISQKATGSEKATPWGLGEAGSKVPAELTWCPLQVRPTPKLWVLLLVLLGVAWGRTGPRACSVAEVLRHYRAVIFEDLQAAVQRAGSRADRTTSSRHFRLIQTNLTRAGAPPWRLWPGASCGSQKEHSILLSIASLGRTLRGAVSEGRSGDLEKAAWTVAVRTEAVMRRHCKTRHQRSPQRQQSRPARRRGQRQLLLRALDAVATCWEKLFSLRSAAAGTS